MAGKYLDLEIKWLREDLDSLREDLEKEIEYLREDLEFIRRDIAQIQDLVGIERKDSFTIEELVRFDIHLAEAVLKKVREKVINCKNVDPEEAAEKLEKEIKKYKEQNKPH